MRVFSKALGLAVSAILFIIFFNPVWAQEAPSDLEISLYSAPVMPGAWPGPRKVTIEANDTAILTRTDANGLETTKTLKLDDGAAESLWNVLNEEGFFDLDSAYQNPQVLDGDYAEITVTANGQTKTVRTTNIAQDQFDTIALWINSYFEPEDMVLYNAFLEHGAGDGS